MGHTTVGITVLFGYRHHPERYAYQNKDKNKTSNGAALKMAVRTIYKKENGTWVEQESSIDIFDDGTIYIKGN